MSEQMVKSFVEDLLFVGALLGAFVSKSRVQKQKEKDLIIEKSLSRYSGQNK